MNSKQEQAKSKEQPSPVPQKGRLAVVRLVLAAALFAAWVAWLIYQVATTSNPIVVSRPQILISPIVVEAWISGDAAAPANDVILQKIHRGHDLLGLPAGAEIPKGKKLVVKDIDQAAGWKGPGEYILAIQQAADAGDEIFHLVPVPVSPGHRPGKPPIYPANESTRMQLREALPLAPEKIIK